MARLNFVSALNGALDPRITPNMKNDTRSFFICHLLMAFAALLLLLTLDLLGIL
jgi:hypothetical protein